MNKYHFHNYRETWIDVSGNHQLWTGIDDIYLNNIHRKIKRSGSTFPAQALYYCEQEIENRKQFKIKNKECIINKIREAAHSLYGCNTNTDHLLTYQTRKENSMYQKPETAERPVQIVTRVKDENLVEYFLKKVRWFETGEDFKVIGIGVNRASTKQLTLVPLKGGSKIELDAHDVDIIKQIAVYAYQHKNGEITWTSKEIAPSTLKKQGIKKLESATKYFDV